MLVYASERTTSIRSIARSIHLLATKEKVSELYSFVQHAQERFNAHLGAGAVDGMHEHLLDFAAPTSPMLIKSETDTILTALSEATEAASAISEASSAMAKSSKPLYDTTIMDVRVVCDRYLQNCSQHDENAASVEEVASWLIQRFETNKSLSPSFDSISEHLLDEHEGQRGYTGLIIFCDQKSDERSYWIDDELLAAEVTQSAKVLLGELSKDTLSSAFALIWHALTVIEDDSGDALCTTREDIKQLESFSSVLHLCEYYEAKMRQEEHHGPTMLAAASLEHGCVIDAESLYIEATMDELRHLALALQDVIQDLNHMNASQVLRADGSDGARAYPIELDGCSITLIVPTQQES